MAASFRLIPTSMAEGLLHSLPTAFFSKPSSLPLLRSHKPLPFLNLSRPSSSLFPRKKLPSLLPLVAQTSDWARQEEDAEQEEEEVSEGDDGGFDLEGLVEEGAEGGLFEGEEEVSEGDDGGFDSEGLEEGAEGGLFEGEEEEEQAAVGGVVAEEDRTIVDEGEEEVEEEEPFPEPPEGTKLFVGNLPYDMDSERLSQLFEKAGVVEVAEVIYNRATDQSRGFGFVTMSTVEDAEKAVEMYHRYEISGRLLTVNKAAPRAARSVRTPQEFEPSFRIYAANLPWAVGDSRLEQMFSEHGEVLEARVVYDRETGRSRGFGFVKMASEAEMEDAIAALDGQVLDGRAIRVNVAEERRQRPAF